MQDGPSPDSLPQALHKITDYLARRDHSVKELREKLSRRFSKDIVEQALSEAQAQGWFKTPEELAEQVAEQLFRRGKGPFYVNGYLRKKGLPSLNFDDERVLALCRELLERKFPNWEEMSFKELQRPQRFLLQRGFPERLVLAVTSGNS